MSGRIELKDLRLTKNSERKVSDDAFRNFAVRLCSQRQGLRYADRDLTWASVGVEDPGVPLRLSSWSDLVQKAKYVLALEPFPKHGSRLEAT